MTTVARKPKTPKAKAKVTKIKASATPVSNTPPPGVLPYAPGQKWQLELGYAEIVHVGKFLLDFRFYRVAAQKRVPLETQSIQEFTTLLKKNKAQLVPDGSAPRELPPR
jgi:hypothetical protein